MQDQRYPKRKATVVSKEKLSRKLVRIYLKVDLIEELPSDLLGRHIKLFPFDDEYMKSYTVSSHEGDLISLDIALHLKGKGSQWANDCTKNDSVVIWGPKRGRNLPVDLKSKKVLLVSDLSGFSTMGTLVKTLDPSAQIQYILKSKELPKGFEFKNTELHFAEELNLDKIVEEINLFDDSFVILGIEDIKYLNSKINLTCNIKLKAYWK